MGKSNKRVPVKTNRRGTPKVKNRDSNESTGLSVEEIVEKIEEVLAPIPVKPAKKSKTTKKEIV